MAIPSKFTRFKASLAAQSWLNSLDEGIRSGAIVISPSLTGKKAAGAQRALERFRHEMHFIRKSMDWSDDIHATWDLRLKPSDFEPEEPYKLTTLLREAALLRDGMANLREALSLLDTLDISNDERLRLKSLLTTGIAKLDAVPLSPQQWIETGRIGELMRLCDEAIERVVCNLRQVRRDEYSDKSAEILVANCEELRVRAQAVADHLRHVGLE